MIEFNLITTANGQSMLLDTDPIVDRVSRQLRKA
jgi:hypothetical protein